MRQKRGRRDPTGRFRAPKEPLERPSAIFQTGSPHTPLHTPTRSPSAFTSYTFRAIFAPQCVNVGWIRRATGNSLSQVRRMPATSDLPEGYRLDLLGDPDAPALRRLDGTVVARFAA